MMENKMEATIVYLGYRALGTLSQDPHIPPCSRCSVGASVNYQKPSWGPYEGYFIMMRGC